MKITLIRKMNRVIVTFFSLMIMWFLFTFSLDSFSLLLGGIFSLTISISTHDLFLEKEEKRQQGLLPRFEFFLVYVFVLLWEIYLASFYVVYQVIAMKPNPGIVKIRTHLKSKFAQVLLANSITLTPGTVTIDLHDNYLYVHWLVVKTIDSHKAARMIKGSYEVQLRRIFYWIHSS